MWKSSTEKKRTYTQVVDLIAIFSQVVKKGEPAVQRCAVEQLLWKNLPNSWENTVIGFLFLDKL